MTPLKPTKFTGEGVADAIDRLKPGQVLLYHVGVLHYDREFGPLPGAVNGAGMAAWAAYKKGTVTLVQHKLGPLQYEYLAIRRKRSKGARHANPRTQTKPVQGSRPVVLENGDTARERAVPVTDGRVASPAAAL